MVRPFPFGEPMVTVWCKRCSDHLGEEITHRLSNGAIKEILVRAQNGELNTVKGNTVCLYALFGEGV